MSFTHDIVSCNPGRRIWLHPEAPRFSAQVKKLRGEPSLVTDCRERWEEIAGFRALEVVGDARWLCTERPLVVFPKHQEAITSGTPVEYDGINQVVRVSYGPMEANAAIHKWVEDFVAHEAKGVTWETYVEELRFPDWYSPFLS